MNEHIALRLQDRRPPFDGKTVVFPDHLSFTEAADVLRTVLPVLAEADAQAEVLVAQDWLEVDATQAPARRLRWQELDALLHDEPTLGEEFCDHNSDVRLGIGDRDGSFYLRLGRFMPVRKRRRLPFRRRRRLKPLGTVDLTLASSRLDAVLGALEGKALQAYKMRPAEDYFASIVAAR